MATGKRIEDLLNVEVEHMLGATTERGLVVLRAESEHMVLLGHLPPAQAREVAANLTAAAARAEYEQDFAIGAGASGLDDDSIGRILHFVRRGEIARMTTDLGGF